MLAKELAKLRTIGWLVTLMVIAVIVAAIVVAGTPAVARMRAIDSHRSSDLSSLSWDMKRYFERKRSLPESLEDLLPYTQEDSLYDPVTTKRYEYRKVDATHYELCATFETDTTDRPKHDYDGVSFEHHKNGRHCFLRDAAPPGP